MKPSKGAWAGLSAAVVATVTGGAAAAYLVPTGGAHTAQAAQAALAQPAGPPIQQVVPVRQQAVPVAQQAAAPRGVQAKEALLYDVAKKKVLWSRGADTRVAVGSMTKTMTALVVLEEGNLDRKITIKPKYTQRVTGAINGSTAHLRVGDQVTARELLYATMLPSGCDAAAALADAYGGYTAFVNKMNREAARLGLKNTHYNNFDGLSWTPDGKAWPAGNNLGYSTARDQVTLGRIAMRNATFRAVVATRTHTLAAGNGHNTYTWQTTNALLGAYPGVDGIKTGHTDRAGYCLNFSDLRNRRDLVGVVLGSGTDASRFNDSRIMLDWAFHTRTVFSLDKAAQGLPSD